ncbi:MAG: cell division protein FtsL [Gammaproteobacteria bacterium]
MIRSLAIIVLFLATVSSALASIWVRHEARKLVQQLQALDEVRDELYEEWGRLQLEQATWGTHSRLEAIARKNLGMTMPRGEQAIVVSP